MTTDIASPDYVFECPLPEVKILPRTETTIVSAKASAIGSLHPITLLLDPEPESLSRASLLDEGKIMFSPVSSIISGDSVVLKIRNPTDRNRDFTAAMLCEVIR